MLIPYYYVPGAVMTTYVYYLIQLLKQEPSKSLLPKMSSAWASLGVCEKCSLSGLTTDP